MFGNKIVNTTLTTELADHAFSSVTADEFRGDKSLAATARALFVPRGKDFHGKVAHFAPNMLTAEEQVYAMTVGVGRMLESSVLFVNISRTENEDEAFAVVERVADDAGFVKNEQASNFMTTFCSDRKVVVYNKDEEKKSVVVAMDISMHQWHVLLSGLPTCYAKWNMDSPLNEDEIQMLQALADPQMGVDQFLDAVEKIAAKLDLQTEAKRFYLDGFEKRALRNKIGVLGQQTKNIMNDIERYISALQDLYERKAGVDALLAAASSANGGESNELMEYFIANKKLVVDSVSDNDRLTYYVSGYIDNFDQETFELALENQHSVIYSRYDEIEPDDITEEDYIKLMRAIFLSETIRIKVYSKWELNTGGSIQAMREESPPIQFKHCLPNPHLMYYRCYGSFEPELMKAAGECDYIRAVDISSAENGNVNWNDITVMKDFIRDILTKKTRFLELPDGTEVTNTEAIAWLKAQDAA